MRRLAILIFSISLASLLAFSGSSGAVASRRGTSTKCSSGHPHVIVANAQAQVYEAPESPRLPEFPGIFGCAYGRQKSYLLGSPPVGGSPSGIGGVTNEALAGPIVAYEESLVQPSSGFSSWFVLVRDLRNGRVLHRVPTGTRSLPKPNLVGNGSTTVIVVKRDGAVAWIVESNISPVEYEVHALDKTGSRVLASGSGIEPRSLALAGSTLYWMQGGEPMSAVLN
jgi:hypothetical protein